MNKYSKYVNALFILGGVLVWFITSHYTEVAIGYFQLGRKIGGAAIVLRHVLPLVLGVATFLLLRSSVPAVDFTADAVSELVKVNWPEKKQVYLGTVVVIITVLLAGVLFGVLDLGLTALVRAILGA